MSDESPDPSANSGNPPPAKRPGQRTTRAVNPAAPAGDGPAQTRRAVRRASEPLLPAAFIQPAPQPTPQAAPAPDDDWEVVGVSTNAQKGVPKTAPSAPPRIAPARRTRRVAEVTGVAGASHALDDEAFEPRKGAWMAGCGVAAVVFFGGLVVMAMILGMLVTGDPYETGERGGRIGGMLFILASIGLGLWAANAWKTKPPAAFKKVLMGCGGITLGVAILSATITAFGSKGIEPTVDELLAKYQRAQTPVSASAEDTNVRDAVKKFVDADWQGNGLAWVRASALDRMVAEMVYAEMLTKEELATAMRASNVSDVDDFIEQFAAEMPNVVSQRKASGSNILEFTVTKIEFDASNGTAKVTGCAKLADAYEMMRLYFVKLPEGWRLYDLLIFSSSARFTIGMAAGLTAASGGTASGAAFMKSLQEFGTAMEHLKRGNDTAAVIGFKRLLATNPPEAFRRIGALMLATAHVRNGDATDANAALRMLTGLEREMPTMHHIRAEIALIEDDPSRAVRSYQNYLKAVGDDPGVLNALAITQLEMGRPADALESIKRALSVLPNEPELRRTYNYSTEDLERLKRGERLRHKAR